MNIFLFLSGQNNTYVSNVGYPVVAATGTALSCVYTVEYISHDICQLRLDFNDFVLPVGTNDLAVATTASFTAAGPSGNNPPVMGGTNTGQHSKGSMFLSLYVT